jgi:uncharacterized repeat protein (TIGR01451 family)
MNFKRLLAALGLALTSLAQPLAAYADGPIPVGPEFRVNTYTIDHQWSPSVAMDADGDFVVAWWSDGQDGSGYGVYAQRYTGDGTPAGGEFRVNTHTTDYQWSPGAAMDADGDFVVAWQSGGQDGSSLGVYAQRYTGDGTPAGGEFRVNTYTTSWQGEPGAAMDADGDFVVAWTSDGQDGSSSGVYAQRYTGDGTPAGGEFRVNTYTTGVQQSPSVAMDADGDFVVAWESYGQDGSSWGVYAQRYAGDGTPAGGEFRVNTYTGNDQLLPGAAMDADGDFVVAWESLGQDGSGYGVYAQRYAIPNLTLAKTVDDALPDPGQRITYTLTVANSSFLSATHALVSDSLASELNFVGPITLDPPGAGSLGSEPPILVSELTISPNTCITLAFPVTVSLGLAKGTPITNTAAVTGSGVITTLIAVRVVSIPLDTYLPLVLKGY